MPPLFRRTSVNKQPIADVLEEYSEALLRGEDRSHQLLEHYPESSGILTDLFSLTNRLCGAMVPIEPSQQFVADLKASLAHLRASAPLSTLKKGFRPRPPALTRIASPQRSIVSVVAGVALITSLVGSVVMLVALLIGRGRRRHPAPVA